MPALGASSGMCGRGGGGSWPSVRVLSAVLLAFSLAGVVTTAPGGAGADGGDLAGAGGLSGARGHGGGARNKMMMAQGAVSSSMAMAAPAPMHAMALDAAAPAAQAAFDGGGGGGGGGRGFVFEAGAGAGVSEEGPPLVAREVLIREAHLSAETPDVARGAAAVAALAAGAGGSVDASSVHHAPAAASEGEWRPPSSAHVQARVPAAALDEFLAGLRVLLGGGDAAGGGGGGGGPTPLEGARLLSESVSVRDAGGEHVDAAARERGEERALKAMEALLAAAANVADVLAVRREMQAIATRLESARAQRTGLEGRAALSSVSVALQTPNWTPPPPPRPPGWSVGAVAGRALGTLLAAAQFAAEVGVFAAVFALPLLALLLLTAPLARAIWARLPLPAAWRAARSGVLQPAPSPTTSDDA